MWGLNSKTQDHDLSWSQMLSWLNHPGTQRIYSSTPCHIASKSRELTPVRSTFSFIVVFLPTAVIFFGNFLKIYLFLRETEHKWGRARERRRHRIRSKLQALSCQHRAQRWARTRKPWDHDLSQGQMLNWLSHPSASNSCHKEKVWIVLLHSIQPQILTFFVNSIYYNPF